MKKLIVLLVVALVAACFVPASATKLDWGLELSCTPEMYSENVDLSEHEVIYLVMVGDTPADWGMVLTELNKRLEPYNTELDVTVLSWGDHGTMYPLMLTSGDNIDICYMGAGWCHLWEEAGNGNLLPLTMEFIETYMPMTYQYQDPASWLEVTYNGDIIGVCQGFCSAEPSLTAIRKDLREAYGIAPLTDYASFKAYLLEVASHTEETGLIAFNTPASEGLLGNYLRSTTCYFNTATNWRYVYKNGELPTVDELYYSYRVPEYRGYLDEAKELNEAGVWSRSAISKTETLAQTFGNGQSAAMGWNFTVYQYMEMAEEIDGVTCEAYDLSGDMPFVTQPYNNSVLSIFTGSKNPERAAMVIDIVKWDFDINVLIMFGIEGYHFTSNGDSTYALDPVNNANFPPFAVALSWAIFNGDWNESFENPAETEMYGKVYDKAVSNVTNGFVLDVEPVAAYKAAVDACVTENCYTLGLGFFDDADVAYQGFLDALDVAGFQQLDQEFRTQYQAWYDSVQG